MLEAHGCTCQDTDKFLIICHFHCHYDLGKLSRLGDWTLWITRMVDGGTENRKLFFHYPLHIWDDFEHDWTWPQAVPVWWFQYIRCSHCRFKPNRPCNSPFFWRWWRLGFHNCSERIPPVEGVQTCEIMGHTLTATPNDYRLICSHFKLGHTRLALPLCLCTYWQAVLPWWYA